MENEQEFIKDYLEKKLGTFTLSKKYGVSATTLSNILKKHNIVARRHKQKKVDLEKVKAFVLEQQRLQKTIVKLLGILV